MNKKYYYTTKEYTNELYDSGLRKYLLNIYNYISIGLTITGATAFIIAKIPELFNLFFETPLRWILLFAPIGVIFYLSAKIQQMTLNKAQTIFWIFSILTGISLAYIPYLYEGESLARVFLVTAGTFGTMSLYGHTTNKDLTAMGSLMMMGLLGTILASIVNLFFSSTAVEFAICMIGVISATGLIAWDTQKIRQSYLEGESKEITSKKAIMGALNLYLNIINLFSFLLRLIGERKN